MFCPKRGFRLYKGDDALNFEELKKWAREESLWESLMNLKSNYIRLPELRIKRLEPEMKPIEVEVSPPKRRPKRSPSLSVSTPKAKQKERRVEMLVQPPIPRESNISQEVEMIASPTKSPPIFQPNGVHFADPMMTQSEMHQDDDRMDETSPDRSKKFQQQDNDHMITSPIRYPSPQSFIPPPMPPPQIVNHIPPQQSMIPPMPQQIYQPIHQQMQQPMHQQMQQPMQEQPMQVVQPPQRRIIRAVRQRSQHNATGFQQSHEDPMQIQPQPIPSMTPITIQNMPDFRSSFGASPFQMPTTPYTFTTPSPTPPPSPFGGAPSGNDFPSVHSSQNRPSFGAASNNSFQPNTDTSTFQPMNGNMGGFTVGKIPTPQPRRGRSRRRSGRQ